jgi:membrane protein required for colicin V production
MTAFDYIAFAILALSTLFGFARGATRELVTVGAFIGAVVATLFGLRLTGPFAHHFIHTIWLARAAALLAGFIIAYLVLRLAGGTLVRGVRQTVLSSLDRVLGAALGFVRGVVVIGVLALLIRAATPPERLPAWFTKARVYPTADAAGAVLRAIAPNGAHMARAVGPAVENAFAAPDNENADAGRNQR